jgi:glycogen operon protein
LTGDVYGHEKDASWLSPSGEEMTSSGWNDAEARCVGLLLGGSAVQHEPDAHRSDDTLLLLFNAGPDKVQFRLPAVKEGVRWLRLLDTIATQDEGSLEQPDPLSLSHVYELHGRSMSVMVLQKRRQSPAEERRARRAGGFERH